MEPPSDNRPDPDSLLQSLKRDEDRSRRGKLKVFFGMSAGVGKTYDMLKAAHEVKEKGVDVVVGYVETHRRIETEELVVGLEVLPRRVTDYRGVTLEEMDIDAILARKPALVLVDELAHTNAPGSRHARRYQDVLELLDNGIDVYTTLNVQHLESRADTVAQITGAMVRETVPDSMFEHADSIEIIDIPPDELLRRLADGKVYTPDRSALAVRHFFRKGNLTALREMALRVVAERVDHQLREFMQSQRIQGPWKSGERLVVGISASPNTVRLIRWARRTAYAMDASWVAVHVESAKPLAPASRDQLAKNIHLARELGAEIVTTAGEDVGSALLRVAREQNASQILVGKPSAWSPFRRRAFDRIIADSGNLDVHVVGGDDQPGPALRTPFLPEIHSGPLQYAAAAAAVLLVVLLSYPLAPTLGYQTVSLILLMTVALLPLRLGTGPVLLAAALSALAWNYFFIPPQFTFAIGVVQDLLMFAMYFCIATVSGVLTARIRSREMAVRLREARATALYGITRDLALARSQDDVARAAVENIRKYFNAGVAVLLSQADGDIFTSAHPASSFVPEEKELSVAAWVYWNERRAGRFTDTLPFAQATYYPCSGPRYPLGVIGVYVQGEWLTAEQETLLENFISQIASSLEREQLNEIAKKTVVVAESERLYKTLFNSISHELKTPIATILGSSENLLADIPPSESDRVELTSQIHTAGLRLQRLIENLLDMTRLESGMIKPNADWCDVQDLLQTTAGKLSGELGSRTIAVTVAPSLPLVQLDFGLMEQALTNLLRNAAMYTPAGSPIAMHAELSQERKCVISVSDDGPGFPPGSLAHVFNKFYRVPGSPAGGTGLGLSIVRGFVEAQGGTISAENRPEGGARFLIAMPVHSQPSIPHDA